MIGLDKQRQKEIGMKMSREVDDVAADIFEHLLCLRHGLTNCACVSSFNAHSNCEAGTVINPILQMRTLRHSKPEA